jgi:3-oxoacyl-[acyl-carrier-protein] synthase-3
MKFERVCIAGTAAVMPPREVTSVGIEARLAPLYERLRLPEGRLELMTGIASRHFWTPDKLPSAASADAGRQLLKAHPEAVEEIDLLIHCGVCRDRLEPATAAYVHGLLGLSSQCQILDVSNACLGFANAMLLAAGLIESGQIRKALLVSGENGESLLENTVNKLLSDKTLTRRSIKPYFANLTIGAGAAAMLMCSSDTAPEGSLRLTGAVCETDSEANTLCQGEQGGSGGLEMLTEAEALLEAGIALAGRTWNRFLGRMGWSVGDICHSICHQVGKTHQLRLLHELGLDVEKDVVTYPKMGNVGSVSLPFTLHEAIASGIVSMGDRLALLGIGSGLSCAMLGLEA